jgi:hypothetical protein
MKIDFGLWTDPKKAYLSEMVGVLEALEVEMLVCDGEGIAQVSPGVRQDFILLGSMAGLGLRLPESEPLSSRLAFLVCCL